MHPTTTQTEPLPEELFRRYRELREYVSLTELDEKRVIAAWPLVQPLVPGLVEDFYQEILLHEEARAVLADLQQVERLKSTLAKWISELFVGKYDVAFVQRRWQVGFRHVQIGLAHVWVSAAMSRLRERLTHQLYQTWGKNNESYVETVSAIRRMMDLDLALIQDAYHAESVAAKISVERDFAEGVIETAQAVVMVVTACGQIVRGNAFLRQLLLDAGESSFGNIFQLIADSECPLLAKFLSQAVADLGTKPLETQLRLADGSSRRIRWLARKLNQGDAGIADPIMPLRVPDPLIHSTDKTRAHLVLCVGQDITDLTQAQRLLVRQERLAAIGQTMTGLAHESRNAFQRSQASLETLLLELEDRPVAVELIERIQRAHDHLLHLYEEVLQFARPVRLELQPVRVISHVRQTWQYILQGGMGDGATISFNDTMTSDEVSGDPFALEQVFRNLLENAAQASDFAAMIDVSCRDTFVGSDPAVKLCIRDHGRGLPAEYRERLFEPFFTTRSRGTGLGLAIARRLVEAHGGSLKLFPAEGRGTIAEIILPRTAIPDAMQPPTTDDPRRSGSMS